MSSRENMLLVGDRSARKEFSSRLGEETFVYHGDPYDALLEMGKRRWSAIVLTAPQADFAGLCRASRRLQSDSRLFAVCPPAAEPEMRGLVGNVLDDYFIYPPTPRELDEIRRPATTSRPGGLSAEDYAELLDAARSPAALEDRIAALVRQRLGTPTQWLDEAEAPPDAEPLLLLADDAPRVLAARESDAGADPARRAFLADLQRVLGPLVAAAKRTESLHRLAVTDHLTGAYNRRYFYHLTDQILLRATRQTLRVTLLLYDIDDFKHYNDEYGHAVGDEILCQTAKLMRQITRSHDVVARIGGDEFAVLFWDAKPPRSPDSHPPEDAYELADRFRQAVETMEFPSLGPEARGALSISGGLASFPEGGRTCRDLLRTADGALRQVKQTGKNAIHIVGPK